MIKRFLIASVGFLAALNLMLAVGVSDARASVSAMDEWRTCSIQSSTGNCRCHHTIKQECLVGGDLSEYCEEQCNLEEN